MYDINKRKELKNAKVKDILEILKELPEDADVFFNGDTSVYIHIDRDSSTVCFDDEDLDDEYVNVYGKSVKRKDLCERYIPVIDNGNYDNAVFNGEFY